MDPTDGCPNCGTTDINHAPDCDKLVDATYVNERIDEVKSAVARGAEFLDGRHPGWRDCIRVDMLRFSPLEQLYPARAAWTSLGLSPGGAVTLGFDFISAGTTPAEQELIRQALVSEWQTVLQPTTNSPAPIGPPACTA